MLFIHKTVSLCDICYKHIPAVVYEHDGKILISKKCNHHGEMTSIVEPDAEFYYGLEHKFEIDGFNQILFEVTDRCQLNCPHCYHLPDNKNIDKPIDQILEQVSNFPNSAIPMIAGAEPTLRKDFAELCQELSKLEFNFISVLSNGLRFDNKAFTKKIYNSGLKNLCLGLNHPSYQGETVHAKQLRGLQNMIDTGFQIGYVGYTIESYDHLPFILDEIKQISSSKQILQFRIRCGSFIGRSSDKQRGYLSTLVKKIKEILGNDVIPYYSDDNIYHVMLNWNGIILRIIQWPDVTNIDMEELATGPWCQFYNGPITNFVHQVITRDAYINEGLPQLDIAPEKYHYKIINDANPTYWKTNWTGPITFSNLDWFVTDIDVKFSKQIIPVDKL